MRHNGLSLHNTRMPTTDTGGSAGAARLSPLAAPSGEGELAAADLPPVHQALLLPEVLEQLFCDIRQFGSAIQWAPHPSLRGAGDELTGEALFDALKAGRIDRCQVRYVWRGRRWIDTVQRFGVKFRLIRIAHPIECG